ncbi:MAG: histidine phosphatase family protein [Candidatus Staskawiczbacteria bacterium]|nr:histidine phosphatase family protein [Candidatus Staskawiczbacteria bacterium]
MAKLFLLRHLKSQWNLENRFAGWVDNPLSKEGSDMAKTVAQGIVGQNFDVIYTSPLIRNMQTVIKILKNIGEKYPLFIHLDGGKMQKWGNFSGEGNYISAFVSEKLNERYYGSLQGLDKKEIAEKYGEDQAKLWRRGFNNDPPGGGEGLDEVVKRAVPFYKKYIEKDLKAGKNVLVVSSHNSLRAIVKYIENIPEKEIVNLELPFGALVKYDFDGKNYSHLQ